MNKGNFRLAACSSFVPATVKDAGKQCAYCQHVMYKSKGNILRCLCDNPHIIKLTTNHNSK